MAGIRRDIPTEQERPWVLAYDPLPYEEGGIARGAWFDGKSFLETLDRGNWTDGSRFESNGHTFTVEGRTIVRADGVRFGMSGNGHSLVCIRKPGAGRWYTQ